MPTTTTKTSYVSPLTELTQIFTHLVFYIDTVAHAKQNGLQKSSPDDDVAER